MTPPPSVITSDAPAVTSDAPVAAAPPMTVAAAMPIAFGRVLVVVALATLGSLWPHPSSREAAAFYIWGLVWLPWSIFLLFAADGARRRVVGIGGFVGDTAALLASLALLPDVPGLFLAGLLVALVTGWLCWPELSRGWSAAGVVLAATAIRIGTSFTVRGAASAIAFAIIAALTCVIWVRTDRISRRAETLTSSLRSRAETVLARVPHPLVISGPNGRIVSWNPSTVEVLGRLSREAPCCESLGLHFGERALTCEHGCALLQLCRDSDGGYVEVWRYRDDGGRQPLLASAAEIPDANGRVVEVVHSIRDITRLKEADEAKTIFLATASHELKTPLTVINGYAQLLLRDADNEDLRKQGLDAIASRAKELAEIVERLLLSSRIESGRLAVTLTPIDLTALVTERVESLATATNRVVDLHVDKGLPLVNGDETAAATLFDHLIDNAMKYSPREEAIEVRVTGEEHWVTVSVHDRGAGMSDEQRRRCFDKFWQAESGDSRRHGGTGLGLYIVKSLVDSMAGRITVDSALGEGTTFHVTLPTPDGQLPAPRVGHNGDGEPSMIREFMRQIGVPNKAGA
jgi:PAS domain S-box-containing protein